ncbi:DUF5777 family beta-barrel protein [Pontimicrobium sp. IMCC45349]|uniref:DUF5777 family beta-barrel protein n=1 Tax=Pontimicrobium sp. IMCC45349 TaxID=3391574 RepID=UPI00399F2738
MKKYVIVILFISLCVPFTSNAQEDLLDMLESSQEPQTNYTIATFKNTKLVSGNSIETNGQGVLQFMIQHRFGTLNSGWRDLWGLDNSTIRLGFEYGITDHLNIGLGRASFLKTYDGMIKWRFLRQKSGAKNFPFSATAVSSIYLNSSEWIDPERENYFSSRLSFHHSLLIARKFNDKISIQLMPTMVHTNLVSTPQDENTVYAMGFGTSIKLSGSIRLNAEYYYLLPDQVYSKELTNSLSIGVDIETGGHVFQLHVTNSKGMTEQSLVTNTTGAWGDGDIYFGFNISRVFNVGKKKVEH